MPRFKITNPETGEARMVEAASAPENDAEAQALWAKAPANAGQPTRPFPGAVAGGQGFPPDFKQDPGVLTAVAGGMAGTALPLIGGAALAGTTPALAAAGGAAAGGAGALMQGSGPVGTMISAALGALPGLSRLPKPARQFLLGKLGHMLARNPGVTEEEIKAAAQAGLEALAPKATATADAAPRIWQMRAAAAPAAEAATVATKLSDATMAKQLIQHWDALPSAAEKAAFKAKLVEMNIPGVKDIADLRKLAGIQRGITKGQGAYRAQTLGLEE